MNELDAVITPRTPLPLVPLSEDPERDVDPIPHLSTFLAPVSSVPPDLTAKTELQLGHFYLVTFPPHSLKTKSEHVKLGAAVAPEKGGFAEQVARERV